MATKHDVTLVGNSIPASLEEAFDPSKFTDLSVSADVNFGCDPFPAQKVLAGHPVPDGAECPDFRTDWRQVLRASPPDVAIFMVPQSITSDMRVDGATLKFGSSAYRTWLATMLGTLRKQALTAGARHFAVTTLACHRIPPVTQDLRNVDDDDRVRTINTTVRRWAQRTHTPVYDLHNFLCKDTYHATINGLPLYADGLHFTKRSGSVVWSWLAPQLQQTLRAGR